MKDLKPTEPEELIEMQVPIGTHYNLPTFVFCSFYSGLLTPCFVVEDDTAPGLDEEAPVPSAFQYFNWDE